MKYLKIIFTIILYASLQSCADIKEDYSLNGIGNPNSINALLALKADNSGKVTISPTGEGVTQFEIYFGDATTAPAIVNAGSTSEHTYLEGNFSVKIIGKTLNGKTAEKIIPLSVAFFAPTDLVATIAPIQNNSLGITVKAEAKFETGFKVYFGESPTAAPVSFLEGDVISHIYTNAGTYTVKVVAVTGGIAKTEFTQIVTVSVPILIVLPMNFESATLPYNFTSFGGANTVVGVNANLTGINTSAKAAALTKGNGSQGWAGSFIELTNPINFTVQKKIKVKVWSPQAGIVVKMKLENLGNNTINIEKDVTLSTANSWQEITFDFTGISVTNTFQRIVIFFNFGIPGNGAVYYFDDISQSN